MERFVQEAKILLTLRHPFIISVLGFGIHGDKPYILMERFEGYNLQVARERHGSPTPSAILPFLRMVASALGYAHQKSIIHRDLKPTNLMTIKNDARVIDFGIARIVDPNGNRFTQSGGTPIGGAFSAPELTEDPRLEDSRIDIYGLGACWYWLLTGQAPCGRNWEMVLTAIDGVTEDYAAVLFKTLNPIERRFSTMEELELEVRALETGGKIESSDDLLTNDDAMLVLGVVFEQETTGADGGVAIYELDRQVAQHITKLRLRLAVRQLLERKLLRVGEARDWNNTYDAYFVEKEGQDIVAQNPERFEKLLSAIEPSQTQSSSQPTGNDNIPF